MAFLAIRIPEDLIHSLNLPRLSHLAPDWAWVKPLDLHITLRFFSIRHVDDLSTITQALKSFASPVEPFELHLGKAGIFERGSHGGVFWIGVQDIPFPLRELQNALQDLGAQIGWAREERAYIPHITLARYKAKHSQAVEAVMKSLENHEALGRKLAVHTIVLMERTKKDPDRVYQELLSCSLPLGPGLD